jgi:probable HAF family extracellular repeat protein
MVGEYQDGVVFNFHAFMLIGGIYTTIDPPGAIGAEAMGINDAKQVVGLYSDAQGTHGFLFDGVNFVNIDYPGARITFPNAINNDGEIVGQYELPGGAHHGFTFRDGVYTTLDPPKNNGQVALWGINSHGGIVGSAAGAHVVFGFRYDNGQFKGIEFPGAQQTIPHGLNDSGAIVGAIVDEQHFFGFSFVKGRFHRINFPKAITTSGQAINNSGQIVGVYTDSTSHGFLITP